MLFFFATIALRTSKAYTNGAKYLLAPARRPMAALTVSSLGQAPRRQFAFFSCTAERGTGE